jgi:hypothetical protein
MTPSDEREQLIQMTARHLAGSTSHNPLRFRDAIKSFTTETLNRLSEFSFSRDQRETITSGFFFFDWDEAIANDYLAMTRAEEFHIITADIDKHIDALKFYDGVVPHSGGAYPEERAAQVVAITRVLCYMHNQDENILVTFKDEGSWKLLPFINEPKLRELLVKSPQRDAVVSIVIERGIMDADVITAMLESSIPVLVDGVL